MLQVLAEAGAAGLSTAEIARRIQAAGLRDLRTCKSPEVLLLTHLLHGCPLHCKLCV